MAAPSTRKVLLSLIDDVEIVSKELLDIIATPKSQRSEDIDTGQLLELLVEKDKECQEALKIAKEQEELQKKYDALKEEVDKRDREIRQLQQNLKDAENILSTAIYQAKRKLKSINQASQKKISSEELIKYAHKISASNAVAAPPTWAPGDPRRPYPTDMDMRHGILSRFNDISTSHPGLGIPSQSLVDMMGHNRQQSHLEQALNAPLPGQPLSHPNPVSMSHPHPPLPHHPQPPPYQWQSSMDSSHSSSGGGPSSLVGQPLTHSPRGGGSTTPGFVGPVVGVHPLHPHSHQMVIDKSQMKPDDDVELMSSDSSSSSSSDE